MKKISIISCILYLTFIYNLFSEEKQSKDNSSISNMTNEKIGIIIYTNEPETIWNAFRLANFAVEEGDSVSVFLLGKGVEATEIIDEDFNIEEMMSAFIDNGGNILACGTCLTIRKSTGKSEYCLFSSLADLYKMLKESDKIITF